MKGGKGGKKERERMMEGRREGGIISGLGGIPKGGFSTKEQSFLPLNIKTIF